MTITLLKNARFLTLSAVLTWALPLPAADPMEVHWNEVCRVAASRQLEITTANGDTVEGYCMSINIDEIAVTTQDHKVVKIARSALSKLQMHRSKGHQLSSLGKGMRSGLKLGFDALLSPNAVGGLVMVPGTLAWGVVSAPFCLLGDLKDKLTGKQEIKLL